MRETLIYLKNLLIKEKYPLLKKNEYLKLFNNIKNNVSKEIKELENSIGYVIEKSWIDKLALHTQIVKKKTHLTTIMEDYYTLC